MREHSKWETPPGKGVSFDQSALHLHNSPCPQVRGREPTRLFHAVWSHSAKCKHSPNISSGSPDYADDSDDAGLNGREATTKVEVEQILN